jgi:plasmid stabilization system protein ParE
MGRVRDADLRPGLRSFAVGEYVIIYRIEIETVVLLRVMRGSRNIQGLQRG